MIYIFISQLNYDAITIFLKIYIYYNMSTLRPQNQATFVLRPLNYIKKAVSASFLSFILDNFNLAVLFPGIKLRNIENCEFFAILFHWIYLQRYLSCPPAHRRNLKTVLLLLSSSNIKKAELLTRLTGAFCFNFEYGFMYSNFKG